MGAQLARLCLQHPERPTETALVLIGAEGSGKGTLGREMVSLFGNTAPTRHPRAIYWDASPLTWKHVCFSEAVKRRCTDLATVALWEQKQHSMSPEQRWWLEKLTDGVMLPEDSEWRTQISRIELRDDFA